MATKTETKECSTHGEVFANSPKSDYPTRQDNGILRRVLIDGKEVPADRVEIIYSLLEIPGEDSPGDLHVNLTHEGIILDVWNTNNAGTETNSGTSSETAQEIVERICEENS
jgi:hypothetical protein